MIPWEPKDITPSTTLFHSFSLQGTQAPGAWTEAGDNPQVPRDRGPLQDITAVGVLRTPQQHLHLGTRGVQCSV